MSYQYFEAESHVSTYNKFRPSPPKNLVEKIIEFAAEKVPEPLTFAVDVGCGSGQSTEALAPHFKRVLGLDSSEQILKEARNRCHHLNVFYRTCPAEKIDLENQTADVVTVGQAIHWLDIPQFYTEAERILKRNGVLAVYGYTLPIAVHGDNARLATLVENYYKDILSDYTLPQSRKVYIDEYRGEEFNNVYFIEGGHMQRFGDYILETDGSVQDLTGYISSWSAYQNYTKEVGEEKGRDLLRQFEQDFKSLLPDSADDKIKIKFNYFLLLGRKK